MGSRSLLEGAVLTGERRPIVRYMNTLRSSVQKRLNWWRCHLDCGLGWVQGIVLDGGPDPPWDWAILEERGTHWKYTDFLLWAVQRQLNRLICCLGCGLRLAKVSASSVVFPRLHQCAVMARHIGTSWWVWLNHPSMAAMRPYDKLLWPLVDNALKVLIRHQSLDFRVICECTVGHVS